MTRIFWDSNVFIYLLQNTEQHGRRASEMLARIEERGDDLLISTFGLGEVLAGTQIGTKRRQWQLGIESVARVVSFDRSAVATFADLRSKNKVRPGDAVQLAVAAAQGVDLFITADKELARISHVPGINFISDMERAPI